MRYLVRRMPGKVFTQVLELAQERHGYLVPEDLREIGLKPGRLHEYWQRGHAEKVGYGIYRLNLVPRNDSDEYMLAALWPDGRGVLGGETALDLYELCDVNPARIHVTVPRDYRMTRPAPVRYRFVHQDLAPENIERLDGLPIVTPKMAIEQATTDHLRGGLIEQAIDTARNRGLLRRVDADELRRALGGARA